MCWDLAARADWKQCRRYGPPGTPVRLPRGPSPLSILPLPRLPIEHSINGCTCALHPLFISPACPLPPFVAGETGRKLRVKGQLLLGATAEAAGEGGSGSPVCRRLGPGPLGRGGHAQAPLLLDIFLNPRASFDKGGRA